MCVKIFALKFDTDCSLYIQLNSYEGHRQTWNNSFVGCDLGRAY